MKKAVIIILIAAIAGAIYWERQSHGGDIILTGIVTTDEVILSTRVMGALEQLKVKEGDHVTKGELVAQIEPDEWVADVNYYKSAEDVAVSQLAQANADLENARLTYEREENLYKTHVESVQNYDQARTAYDGARARVDSLNKQIYANRAQREKSQVELGYTEVKSPINGIVDTRVAMQGEVVNPGQALVTIVDPDNLWIRADVEETYIDRVKLGDKLTVRLPSGVERQGVVFYRAVDADYATQRDVSRTKRDVKTFQIWLRCDNADRALALGMTAYVVLDVNRG